ncbi:MAG: DUF748 domain-containing protein [Verrucomicrobia bacterium]|nr:DUF748 domain-containing protein [Verrucomicrobiota bacterium]
MKSADPLALAAARPRSSGRWLRRVLAAVPILLVLGVVAAFALRYWVEGFLRSDDFRRLLDRRASEALRAEGHFAPLHREGAGIFSASFDAASGVGPLRKLTAEPIRAELNLRALLRRAWRVDEINLERVSVVLGDDAFSNLPRPDFQSKTDAASRPSPRPPESHGLTALLPSRFELGQVRVDQFALAWNPARPEEAGALRDAALLAHPSGSSEFNADLHAWEIDGRGGKFTQARFPAVTLDTFHLKTTATEIFITRADGRLDGGGTVALSGSQRLDGDRALDLRITLADTPVTPFLPDDWRARLHGQLRADVRIQGPADRPEQLRTSGHAELRDGRLEALPFLAELAVLTATARYRQAPLQTGRADFAWSAGRLTVTNLQVGSDGLLRIEGGFTVVNGQIDGTLQVGVARNSAGGGLNRWLTGAAARVFDQPEHDGFAWTTMRVSGPANAPREDLSTRLLAAARDETVDKVRRTEGSVRDSARELLDFLRPSR